MTELASPVTFTPCRLGRETAYLGEVMIGEVQTWNGGGNRRAFAIVLLPDVPKRFVPAASVEAARETVRRQVADWLDGAGLVPARLGRRG